MHKLRRQAPSPSVLSIGGRQMKDRLDAPLTNARTQLIIQAFFMMVYTYALTHILLFAIELPVKILPLIVVIVVSFVACFIFLRFKRAFIAALVVFAVVVVPALVWPNAKFFHAISESLYALIDKVNDWFYTVFYQIQTPNIDYSSVSIFFAFLISIFMFTWMNLSAAPFAMGLVASVAYGLSEYFTEGAHGIEIKILYLLAMLVVLRFLAERKPAGSRYASLSEMTNKEIKLSSGETSRRNWAAFVAFLLMCFIVLSHVALPTDFFHNKWLDDQIASMVGKKHGRGDQALGYKEFSLKEFGYYPLERRIGGAARPTNTPFLRIHTDGRPLWLKGTAYQIYTEQGWISEGMNPNWRFGHQANQEAQSKYIGVPNVNEEDYMKLVLRRTRVSITPEQDQQVVFQSGRPRLYSRNNDKRAFNAYFNTSGHLYLDSLIPENGYSSVGQSFNVLHLRTSEEITRFGELYDIAYGQPSQRLTKEDRALYLALPDLPDLESRVMEFDETLHRYIYKRVNAISDADIIALIRETLSSRMTYTLRAATPKEGEEFVGWFLREKKGYCTFFATAVTVLAREAKIPARYVEGFLVPATEPGTAKRQVLTGLNAHAWAEVWIEGAGWIPVDATPGRVLDDMARSDYAAQHESEIEDPPPTEPPEETEPTETIEHTLPEPDPQETTQPSGTGRSGSVIWLLYFVPLLIFLLWRQFIFRIRHREKYIEYKLSRWGMKKLVIRIMWDIFTLWALDGKHRKDHESIRSFILRVEISRYTMFPPELIRFIERALYAPEGTTIIRDNESLRTLLDFYREEEVYLRKVLERKRWIFYRWLTSKRHPF
ncbi:MAG: transglutaminase-like domain-containing protein [Saccharofermentanales bacterium]